MLRSDRNILMDAGLGKVSASQHLRGKIYLDSADLLAHKADGQLVGTAFSIPVYRKDALGAGKYQYYDEAGNVIASN